MKTWKTTDEAMKALGIAPIDPEEECLSYNITIAQVVELIEKAGRPVQKRHKVWAADHPNCSFLLSGNIRPFVTDNNGRTTIGSRKDLGWFENRLREICGGWYHQPYFGDYQISHGVCLGDNITQADYKQTYEEAIDLVHTYEAMRWPVALYQYIDGKYVRIGYGDAEESHGEFDARISFEEA